MMSILQYIEINITLAIFQMRISKVHQYYRYANWASKNPGSMLGPFMLFRG